MSLVVEYHAPIMYMYVLVYKILDDVLFTKIQWCQVVFPFQCWSLWYFRNEDDPAYEDKSLQLKLEENKKVSRIRLNAVIEKFVEKQDKRGVDDDEDDDEEEEQNEEEDAMEEDNEDVEVPEMDQSTVELFTADYLFYT